MEAGQASAPQQGTDFGGYEKLVTLSPREHIRQRPGMYIGKLGDGSQNDDGIYVLIKEVIDNSIDEFNTGYAKRLRPRHPAGPGQGSVVQDEHRRQV